MLTITAAGRVGKDAEVNTVGNSTVTEFSLATQIGKDRETFWLNVSVWGKRGEALRPYLTAGTKITAIGALTITQGNDKVFYGCRANQVALQGGPKEQRGDPYPSEHLTVMLVATREKGWEPSTFERQTEPCSVRQ